jgi:phosphoserine phosphatase RsbU/P
MVTGGILLVEDNPVNREICKSILNKLDIPVHCAANGSECLKKVSACQPDLILLDIRMPVMNGFDTLQALQSDPSSSNIPVIMVSSESDVASVVKALSMGASDYLKKPFAAKELLARSHNLLRSRQLEKKIADDLTTGMALQKKFLTNSSGITTAFAGLGYRAALFNKPSATVSGDFYYPVTIDDKTMGFFFADTCGHGLAAALISMRIIGLMSTLPLAKHNPEHYLQIINDDLCGILPPDRFIAASYCTFTATTLNLANAGQPYPLHFQGNTTKELQATGYPLGQLPGRIFTNVTVEVNSGDKIVFYSDGLTEAMNKEEECYGKERLLRVLHQGIDQGFDPEALIESIIGDVLQFCGNESPDDDITLAIIER